MKSKIILIPLILTLFAFSSNAQVKHRSAASGAVSSLANGKKVYIQYCVTCHQPNGSGVATMNPPLINTTYVLGDKITLIKIVLNGFNEDVQINGQTYSNSMPAHHTMTDKEIANVLTYVRNSFGNKATSVSVAMVKSVRAANKK